MTIGTTQDPAILRLLAGRVKAQEFQPYLGTALFAMKPIKTPGIKTLGVDKNWRMYWNPDFITTLTVEQVAACWLHEVGHLLRNHSARFEALGEPRQRHPLWNQAGDSCINEDLRTAGIHLPPIKAIYPESIAGAEAGMITEQVYRILLDSPAADKVSGQKEPLVLLPTFVVANTGAHKRMIGISRSAVLDPADVTITVTHAEDGSTIAVSDVTAHDRRTASWVLDTDLPAGPYEVAITSGGTTITATLPSVPPSITLRPDHLATGWTAPSRVTVVGNLTRFSDTTGVTLTDENEQAYPVTALNRVSDTYLTFDIPSQIPDGLYTVTVTDGSLDMTQVLPIGLPFLDLFPGSLPEGHGFPYPIAAVAEDFTFDATTTVEVIDPLTGPIASAMSISRIKSDTTAELSLDVRLDKGQYVVVASTGTEQAVCQFTVGGQGQGDGEGGDGEGSEENSDGGQGEGQGRQGGGQGGGQGDGQGDGDGEGDFDDCGSGAGGPQREWEQGSDPSDGSVDTGRGNLIREQTARNIQEYAKGRGTVPGGWTRWADTILSPQVDWRKELRSVVRRTCATVAGLRDYSYARPSRRSASLPNVVMPSMRAPRPPLAASVVDTSGSVSDTMLAQAISDMKAMLKTITASGGEDIKIIACDAKAAEMKSVRDMRNLTALEGGGGTDMRVGIQAAAEIRPPVDIVVTFTDGETPWPEEPPATNPRAKYVAVLLAGRDAADRYPPPEWMHTIVVDDAYLRGARR